MLSNPKRLTATGLFVAVFALAITGGLGMVGAMTLRDSKGRAGAVDTASVKDQFPDTPALLVIETGDDAEKSVTGITLMVETPKSGGWLIDIPVDVQVPMAGNGKVGRLADVYKAGGKAGVKEAVEGLMRVTIDDGSVAVMTHADLTGVLAPYAPARVRFTKSIPDPANPDRTFLPSGSQVLDASFLSRLLTFRPSAETATEIQNRRLEIFRALLGDKDPAGDPVTATNGPTTTTATTAPSTAVPTVDAKSTSQFLKWIHDGDHSYPNLCDPSLACKPAKDGSVKLDEAQLRLIVAEAMPGRVNDLGTGPRLRVESHLGSDYNYLLHATMAATSDFAKGVLVSAIETPGAIPAVTEYLYADDSDRDAAEFMTQFLGPGDVKKADRGIDGVDVVVVLGQNFADSVKNEERKTATTTTTTTPTTQSSTTVKKTPSTTKRSTTTRKRRG